MNIITRADFQEAIEAGIRNSPDLINTDAYYLRVIGGRTNQAAFGNWTVDDVHCPARQAGMVRAHSDAPGTYLFSWGYDRALVDKFTPPCVLEIIE